MFWIFHDLFGVISLEGPGDLLWTKSTSNAHKNFSLNQHCLRRGDTLSTIQLIIYICGFRKHKNFSNFSLLLLLLMTLFIGECLSLSCLLVRRRLCGACHKSSSWFFALVLLALSLHKLENWNIHGNFLFPQPMCRCLLEIFSLDGARKADDIHHMGTTHKI